MGKKPKHIFTRTLVKQNELFQTKTFMVQISVIHLGK